MTLLLTFSYLLFFALGLSVGSFLNVVIHRYNTAKSIISPRSHCPCCGTTLKTKDLIPLFSYILLRGRCRYCGLRLSPGYPMVEVISGGVFLACFYYFNLTPSFFKYAVLFCLLLVISGIDLRKKIIPNRFVLLLFGWAVFWQLFYPYLLPESALLGFLAGGGIFLVIALLSRGGMGGGDVKLMAALGFAAGWPYVLILFLLSFLLGGLTGGAMLVLRKKTRKDPLPFAPFLSLAFFLVTFWGRNIWEWYISFM